MNVKPSGVPLESLEPTHTTEVVPRYNDHVVTNTMLECAPALHVSLFNTVHS